MVSFDVILRIILIGIEVFKNILVFNVYVWKIWLCIYISINFRVCILMIYFLYDVGFCVLCLVFKKDGVVFCVLF